MRYAMVVGMTLFVGVAVSFALSADDPALIGLWLFDEGKGDQVLDSSKNKNHGKTNGSFDWTDGKFGKALKAKGGGSIDLANSDSINSISDQLTVAAFYRVDATSDTGIRRQNAFLLEDQSSSEPVPDGWSFRIWTTQGLSPGVYGKTKLNQKEWYHVAGVWDGSVMKLFINGVAEKELVTDGGAATDGKWGGKIGQPADILQLKYGSESYTGDMDEIILLKRALKDSEIGQLTKGWAASLAVSPRGKLATRWAEWKRF